MSFNSYSDYMSYRGGEYLASETSCIEFIWKADFGEVFFCDMVAARKKTKIVKALLCGALFICFLHESLSSFHSNHLMETSFFLEM